jgi:lipoic acid synthetase
MLGAGETHDEIAQSIRDLAGVRCRILTIGQYLSPSPQHMPVARFAPPEEFAEWADLARGLGFAHVESGPLVRSSYRAAGQVDEARRAMAGPAPATPLHGIEATPLQKEQTVLR